MSTAEATQIKVVKGNGAGMAGILAGALGVALLLGTPLAFLLAGGVGPLVIGNVVLGALLTAVYVSTNLDVFRRFAGSRSTGLLAMTVVSVVIVVGLVGVANYLAFKNPKELDLTGDKLYTLSDQTKGVLSRLDKDVHVYAFYTSTDRELGTVQEILRRYAAVSPKLTFEMVDPQARPELVKKYTITERGPRLVITAGSEDARAKDPSEEELTNGIVKVAQTTSKVIYFLTGHGENDIDDGQNAEGTKAAADGLRAEGYTVEKLSLIKGSEVQKGAKITLTPAAKDAKPEKAPGAALPHGQGENELAIPQNAAAVVVGGARSALLGPEVAALETYVQKGGRLIALIEPDSDAGLGTLLKQWKIEPETDLVVDTNPLNRLMGFGAAAVLVQPTEAQQGHPAVKALVAPAMLMAARSLKVASGGLPGVEASVLLESGESAWGETNYKSGSAQLDTKDNAGPVSMGVIAVKPVGDNDKRSDEGRILALGDSEWIDNKYLGVQGNRDLFLNAVNWLAEEQQRIAIHAKKRGTSTLGLELDGSQFAELKFFSLYLGPVLLVALGLGIVLIRRRN